MGLDYQEGGFTEICTFIEPEKARQSNPSFKEFPAVLLLRPTRRRL